MAHHPEHTEHRDVVDAVAGGEGPFNLRSLMRSALSGGGGGNGGGMGESFDPVRAQASIDEGMKQNIYASTFSS
jgi:hypothetical protein